MGSDPPEWVKYLTLASTWGQPPWVLEWLDDNDDEASLWIERALLVQDLFIQKFKKDTK